MAGRASKIAVVGGETALGRELRDQLKDAELADSLHLIGAEDQITGILTEEEGELVVMTPLDAERIGESEILFCAGSPESARKASSLLTKGTGPALVDLTYALEELPQARLRSPLAEPDSYSVPPDSFHVIAHPAATALALLMTRIGRRYKIRHSVVQVLEPASERGQAGMNELQQQTTSLLNFQNLSKAVYDAQLAFNVLPRYGEDAPEKLENVENRIDRHLATLLSGEDVPMPSLRVAQVPVFHGYSISIWTEFDSRPDTASLSEAMASAQVEVRGSELDPPSNAGTVGQPGVIAGVIEPDRNHSRAVWIWAVADNYRLLVDNAVGVARQLLARAG